MAKCRKSRPSCSAAPDHPSPPINSAPLSDPVNTDRVLPFANPLIAAVVAALNEMHPAALAGYVQFQSKFASSPARRRAVLIKIFEPTFSDELIAAMTGVCRTTLYTWPEYMRVKKAMEVLPSLPCGTVDDEGFIESYLEQAM